MLSRWVNFVNNFRASLPGEKLFYLVWEITVTSSKRPICCIPQSGSRWKINYPQTQHKKTAKRPINLDAFVLACSSSGKVSQNSDFITFRESLTRLNHLLGFTRLMSFFHSAFCSHPSKVTWDGFSCSQPSLASHSNDLILRSFEKHEKFLCLSSISLRSDPSPINLADELNAFWFVSRLRFFMEFSLSSSTCPFSVDVLWTTYITEWDKKKRELTK